jgi:hypothetical protein
LADVSFFAQLVILVLASVVEWYRDGNRRSATDETAARNNTDDSAESCEEPLLEIPTAVITADRQANPLASIHSASIGHDDC